VSVTEEYIQVKKKAFALLARREHGVEELRVKLALKGYDELVVRDVLADLEQENYLSDERYVEMMFRYHFGRGQGPRKITSLVKQAHVNDVLIQQAYRDFEGDWSKSAAHERQKKYGTWSGDLKEKIRQTRFLSGRGFEYEQIESAFQ
jgi:regulatory protein